MHLGELLETCAQDPVRRNIDLKSFLHWLKPAVLHDQFLMLKNDGEGQSSGYVTWALVDEQTLYRYKYEARFLLHPSEWHEGSNLIVMDFCSLGDPRRFFKKMLTTGKLLAAGGIDSITACARDKQGNPVKLHQIYLKNPHA